MYLVIDTENYSKKREEIQHKSIAKFDDLSDLECSEYSRIEKDALLKSLKDDEIITSIPEMYGYKLIEKRVT